MITRPFLTDLDSRAAVKGSRDPLGMQQIWTRLGRHVIGNLTTVSDSARDFTVTLLGHYLAARVAEDIEPGTELATFLKWEQLAAYARGAVNEDWAFRGTERVRKNLSEGSRVMISDERAHQILGSQKIYGLWGLYTVASRASGWLDGSPARLTPTALEFVEKNYVPNLEQAGGLRRLREVLATRGRIDVAGRDRPLLEAVASILKRPIRRTERAFYRDHLLFGGPSDETSGRQQQLAELMAATLDESDFEWSPAQINAFAKQARSRGAAWQPLAHHLDRIRVCESVLAPMSMAFTYMLGLDALKTDTFARALRDNWGAKPRTIAVAAFAELRDELGRDYPDAGERWIAIANSAASGNYGELAAHLIEQNKTVMATRGGAAWVETRDGVLHVRFRDEQGRLPNREELPTLWRSPYFLASLRRIALEVRET